jgi:hypothetical protein
MERGGNMLYRVRTAIVKVIVSIVASIAYQIESFHECYLGQDYKAVIQDYDNALRSKIKWTDEEGSYEDARDILWEEMQSRGLKVWD